VTASAPRARQRTDGLRRLVFRSYSAAKAYHRIGLALTERVDDDAILVYQMGKVGSSAVTRSLRAAGIESRIYKLHFLTRQGMARAERQYRRNWTGGRRALHLWESQYLHDKVREPRPGKQWRIVTLVRDPVARNVSAFFQTLDLDGFSGVADTLETRRADLERLTDAFVSQFEWHDEPLTWFDAELASVFGIDVFASPFPHARGYQTYENDSARVLLLRLEDLREAGPLAFAEWLGLESFEPVESNVGAAKYYSDVYREFMKGAKLPRSYLERMYGSRYARHFYSDEEIRALRARWER
jgi:hypothetical protein